MTFRRAIDSVFGFFFLLGLGVTVFSAIRPFVTDSYVTQYLLGWGYFVVFVLLPSVVLFGIYSFVLWQAQFSLKDKIYMLDLKLLGLLVVSNVLFSIILNL